MCGICGFLGFQDEQLLADMLSVMHHRGPDDRGYYGDGQITLGHNRLSIIDVEGGHQPLFNEDKTIVLVFNGEIYNFRELRQELQNRNHTFSTRTDSEVIIHAYEECGDEFLQRLDGMFALALWDQRQQRLLLARDRLGIKPLYYYHSLGKFLFASELKALVQYSGLSQELDMPALFSTLMFRYTPHPDTVLRGIKKLKPAHYLIYSRDGLVEKSYWSFALTEELQNLEEIKEKVQDRLRKTVKSHLVSDVPLGVMLSGGLDSSALVACAAEFVPGIRTFSIGFAGETDNEFQYARLIAEKFQTDHIEISIRPENLNILPRIIWHNDEPVAGPSSLAYYLMLQEAKNYAKVILFGHGADEILAGYEQLKIQKLAGKLLALPGAQGIFKTASFLISQMFKEDYVFERLYRYARSFNDPLTNYLELMAVIDLQEMTRFLKAPWKEKILSHAAKLRSLLRDSFKKTENPLNQILLFDMAHWLTDDINHRLDRITMAASVEGRVPYLDHHFVTLMGQIDLNFKINGYQDKYCLREAMRGILPDAIINRKKQRFNTPIDHFFQKHFDKLCLALLHEKNELNENIFEVDFIKKLLNYKNTFSYKYILRKNKLTAQFYARQLWNYVVFQLWYKMYFQNQAPDSLILN